MLAWTYLALALIPRPSIRIARVRAPELRVACADRQPSAYEAGVGAAQEAAAVSSGRAWSSAGREGRAYKVTLRSKPLGIDLGENPSGRGAYVTVVVAGGVAAGRCRQRGTGRG